MNRQAALLGLLAVVLVGALWWVFLYSPGRDQLAMLDEDIAAAEAETASLTARVGQLERIRAAAPETEALIARLGGIVPVEDPALPAALRQIAAAGNDAGVTVSQLNTSRPTPIPVSEVEGLHEIQVSMTVDGSYFQLVDYFRRLEDPTVSSRGFVFTNLSLAAGEYPTLTGTLTGQMYAVLDPVPQAEGEVEDGAEATDEESTESGDTADTGSPEGDGDDLQSEDEGDVQ